MSKTPHKWYNIVQANTLKYKDKPITIFLLIASLLCNPNNATRWVLIVGGLGVDQILVGNNGNKQVMFFCNFCCNYYARVPNKLPPIELKKNIF